MTHEEKRSDYKIGIYVRESRDDNEENYDTIETQRDLLIDFVSKRNLGEVCRVYIDDNVSGSAFEREGLQVMREDAVQGNIDLLTIKDLSRLGRNNAKTLLLLDFLEEYGVRVITFDGRYDSVRDNDTVGIDTWYNERYVRDISRKIRTNIKFKIQKGEYLGNAPFGYDKSGIEKNKLVVDENTANIVREIYRLYKEGYGYQHIACYLNSRNYQSPSSRNSYGSGKNKWNAVSVQRILSSRVYVGDTVQGVSEKISFKSKKTRRLPSERWVITENTHEAIISREEFEEIQKKRNEKNVKSGAHKGTIHAFRGIIYCGRCGSIMFARARENRPMGYICSNYAKGGKKACSSHHINEHELYEILLNELKENLADEHIRERVENMLEVYTENKKGNAKEIEKLEQNLAAKQKQQDTLYMDKLEGKISDQMFQRLNAGIENRISQICREIKRLKETDNNNRKKIDIIDSALEDFSDNGLTNDLIRLMVNRVVVFETGDNINGEEMEGIDANYAENHRTVVIYFNYKK